MKSSKISFLIILFGCFFCNPSLSQEIDPITINNSFPWCIVAYDSPERNPEQRIRMLKELGFEKYAYDWRDRHLKDTEKELSLALDNNIEIIAVWFWLNAKRDDINSLSPANEKMFNIVKKLRIKTTFWVSMSGNFFDNYNDEESLEYAVKMIEFLSNKATEIDCEVALYNHSGWFANPDNQMKIIKALPTKKLKMVYNFHHGRSHMNNFEGLVAKMQPYLSAVNLNGMTKDGPKIMPLGSGKREKEMISILKNNGFHGPWGILGHVENVDVRTILEQNIKGLLSLENN